MSAEPMPAGFSVERLELLEELPASPDVSERLCAALDEPDARLEELAAIIGGDPGLATRVLRLANSGTYAVHGGVFTIERAISTVGLTSIFQLAVFHQTRQLLASAGRPAPPRLLQHGRVVAVLATHFEQEAGVKLPGLELGALLHDLGHHVLYAVSPDVFPVLAARVQAGASLLEAEQQLLGLDHTAIGLWVATRWHFPAPLLAAISDHHVRAQPAAPTIASLVGLADRWSAVLGLPGFEIDAPPADPEVVGLGPDPGGVRTAELRGVLTRAGVS